MKKYPSIMKEREIRDAPEGVKWIVTEKCHGCNFQFRIDPGDKESVRTFRRTGELGSAENFYGWQGVLERLRPALQKLVRYHPSEVSVFGELIGGHYPGFPKKLAMIQKYIYYCPDHEFVVFDIFDYAAGKFLDFDEMTILCRKAGLHVVRPWYRGKTMDEIMRIDHEDESTRIPEMFGLPAFPNNFIEGWIIRPDRELLTERGSRVMFKRRTNRYLKRAGSDWVDQHQKMLHDEHSSVLSRVPEMLNLAMWESAKSKELECKESIPKFIELIYQDVLEELDGVEMTTDMRKKIRQMIGKFVQAMIIL